MGIDILESSLTISIMGKDSTSSNSLHYFIMEISSTECLMEKDNSYKQAQTYSSMKDFGSMG